MTARLVDSVCLFVSQLEPLVRSCEAVFPGSNAGNIGVNLKKEGGDKSWGGGIMLGLHGHSVKFNQTLSNSIAYND